MRRQYYWLASAATAVLLFLVRPQRRLGDASSAFAQPAAASAEAAVDLLRSAVSLHGSTRPAEDRVLSAILDVQKVRPKLNAVAPFYDKLTGDGCEGGKRWRLVYLANRNTLVAARKGEAPPSLLDRGWYVDGFVTAVQRFEDSTRRLNQNGVFEVLGLGGFFFGYFARFKWPKPATRTTMAFKPVTNNLYALGQDWSWPFADSDSGPEFEASRLQDLNVFNFFYVDEDVAVAQGASGGVAVWGATTPDWEAKHLTGDRAAVPAFT